MTAFPQEGNTADKKEVKDNPKTPELTDAYIDSLIDKLESNDEIEREKAVKKLKKIGKKGLSRIIRYGLKSKHHPVVRTNLIKVLGEIPAKESIEALKKELKSRVAEVVAAAIEAVDKRGDEQLINQEIFPLINSENEMVRRKAILVLGKYGFKSSVNGLCSLLKSEFEHIRVQALKQLKKYPEMKDMIIGNVQPLLKDANADVALEAAVTLKQLKDPRGDEFFQNELIGRNKVFQERAIEYIAEYKIVSGVPFLLKMLKDDQWYLRYIAVDALGEIGDPLGLPSLKVLFETEKVKPVQLAVARVLYKYKHPDTIEFLKSKVSSEKNEDIRWFIVAALGAIGTDDVIGSLIAALEDSNEKIRIIAITALRDITKQYFGYYPRKKAGKRAAPLQEWKLWYRKHRRNKEKESDI